VRAWLGQLRYFLSYSIYLAPRAAAFAELERLAQQFAPPPPPLAIADNNDNNL
jgi:hypothetical protein